jgi:hypothetical protein
MGQLECVQQPWFFLQTQSPRPVSRPWAAAARAMPPRDANTCSPSRIGILLDFHRSAYMTDAKSSHLQRRTHPQRPSRSLVQSRRAHRHSYATRMGVFVLSGVTRIACAPLHRGRDIEELRSQLRALHLTTRKDQATIDTQARRVSVLEAKLLSLKRVTALRSERKPKTNTRKVVKNTKPQTSRVSAKETLRPASQSRTKPKVRD